MNDKPITRSNSVSSVNSIKMTEKTKDKMAKNKNKNQTENIECMGTEEKLTAIIEKLNDTNTGILSLNRKFDNLTCEINELKVNNKSNTEKLKTVDSKVDSIEQYSKRNNLRFFGVPEVRDENSVDVVLQIIAKKMGVQCKKEDIEIAYRIGKAAGTDYHRAIFVKLESHKYKENIYRKRTSLAGSGITVREDLTKERVKLLKLAVDRYGRKNVWTLDGRIRWSENGKTFSATKAEHFKMMETEVTEND